MLKSIMILTALTIASAYLVKKVSKIETEVGDSESPTLKQVKLVASLPVILTAVLMLAGLLPLSLATIAFPVTIPALILSQGFRDLYIICVKRLVIGAVPVAAFAAVYYKDSKVSV